MKKFIAGLYNLIIIVIHYTACTCNPIKIIGNDKELPYDYLVMIRQ